MKTNRLATFGLAAGLLGGGVAGLALAAPTIASAETDGAEAPAGRPGPRHGRFTDGKPWEGDRGARAADALAPLVEAGTITQAQADAVVAALGDRPAFGGSGFPGRGRNLEAAAAALGMSLEELQAALDDGQTMADVAKARGIDLKQLAEARGSRFPGGLNPGGEDRSGKPGPAGRFGDGAPGRRGGANGFPFPRAEASEAGTEAAPAT